MRKRERKAERKNLVTNKVTEEYLSSKNIEIIVQDQENLNEYAARVAIENQLLPKLIHWVEKGRFCVQEHANQDSIHLRVEIFSFDLTLRQQSKEDQCKSLLQ